MKKTILVVIVIIGIFIINTKPVFSQSQRMVLAEEFTSSTCGPCASQNPAFDALLQANPTKITAIKYHMNWPSPGNDPMYLQNTVDNGSRKSYYSINSVPNVRIDGIYLAGSPSQVNQNTINNANAVPSPFDININQRLSAAQDSIYVTMLIKATQEVSGTMVAQIAVIEKHIHFNTAPGTNGEKDFYNVMKKMLPTASGTQLPSSLLPGDYVIIEKSWKLENVYNIDELSVVGFVQNNTNKEVFQAANSSTDPIVPLYANDVEMFGVNNVLDNECNSFLNPVMTLRNNGNQPLTSLVIKYSVNDSEIQEFQWTGNVPTLAKTQVTLPEINFNMQQDNVLHVYGVETNNIGDGYPKNDTLGFAFAQSPITQEKVFLTLKTDDFPEETSWEIVDNNNTVIFSGANYTNANYLYRDTLELPENACYKFIIHDAGGNGICCDNGHGVYQLKTDASVEIIGGGLFTNIEMAAFEKDNSTGIPFIENNNLHLTVFPNPFGNSTNISFQVPEGKKATISVSDVLGNMIHKININHDTQKTIELNCSDMKAGVYFFVLECEGKTVITKAILQP
ncbi:MAG: Omp28-related outer membrane protein [Lentimicrobiaceae bacterium]|nr:Omp28-related outer membrane protein [Lentimicrobiaceae bacterium]